MSAGSPPPGPPRPPSGPQGPYQGPPGWYGPHLPGGPGGPNGGWGGPGMGGDYPPPPKRTGLWIALGAGAVLVVLTVVGLVLAVGLPGYDDASETDGSRPTGGAHGDGRDGTPEPDGDPARYTGPDRPTKVEIGAGPYELPDDPCAAFSPETLVGLGIDGEKGEPTLTDSTIASCTWYHLAGDGSFHNVQVDYTVPPDDPTSVADAEQMYDFHAEKGVGILGDRVEEEKSDVGDESVVVLTRMKDDGHHEATALVRKDNIMVEVSRGIRPDPSDTSGDPTIEWADAQKLMPELARQALNNVG
ncbi:hypothetical protein HNR23_004534 [Nocardiopsis mwathae]|uniref:DUF3558 domain-containing protein n=1 Tax=Nocardiopsis mwathae TaxID=1472723 RepID=A0A7W9YLR1_9ACTN|nr:hypothetical protein [Nocardiopsis mwathae]MBB6174474.1 hypothetical protein [Nocardiopsis mwathae]